MKLKEWASPALWFTGSFILAGTITYCFKSKAIFDGGDNWHYALLFFAIFGGCLAMWGRIATHKQIKQSREQLEISSEQISQTRKQLEISGKQMKASEEASRNDRFAKAVEMLKNDEKGVSGRAGLNMLVDLMNEDIDNSIRCLDVIADYLSVSESRKHAQIAMGIIKLEMENNLVVKKRVEENLSKNPIERWPDISGARLYYLDLQGFNFSAMNASNVNFLGANLKGANFHQTELKDADLTNADMGEAENLTPDQIFSAKWYSYSSLYSVAPKMPNYIHNNASWFHSSKGHRKITHANNPALPASPDP